MIRSILALNSVLLVSLLSPCLAIGQEPSKAEPVGGAKVSQAEEARAKAVAAEERARATSSNLQLQTGVVERVAEQQQEFSRYLETQARVAAKSYDALETNFGLSLSDADDTLRTQLEIPPGEGVVVVGVKAGSLAEQAGLKLNDVLLSLGDQKANNWGQVKQVLLGLGKEALEVKLIREGKPRRMSLVGPEHGFPPEAAEYWIGTPVSPVDETLRTHLTSLPAESGLIVNDVVKGSPADQASVHKDDVLVAMDGKPLTNADALIAQIQASKGKPVPLQVLRAGKPLTITITPAKRAHPTVINSRKNPELLQYKYQVVRPNMAIEVEPRSYAPQPVLAPGQENLLESKPSASGSITLYAPYSGILVDPYSSYQANIPNFPTTYYHPQPSSNMANVDSTARIEGQLKEVVAKLEEIAKALENLKKATGK